MPAGVLYVAPIAFGVPGSTATAAPVPTPLRRVDVVVPLLSVMSTAPVRTPTAVGLKLTVKEQVAFAAKLPGAQLPGDTANSVAGAFPCTALMDAMVVPALNTMLKEGPFAAVAPIAVGGNVPLHSEAFSTGTGELWAVMPVLKNRLPRLSTAAPI